MACDAVVNLLENICNNNNNNNINNINNNICQCLNTAPLCNYNHLIKSEECVTFNTFKISISCRIELEFKRYYSFFTRPAG